MKAFVISVLCTLVGHAVGGSISWPGAVAVRTIIPGETKTTAYSTSQYINAVPQLPASYSFGAYPQFAYQVPHVNSFAALPTGYYPVASQSYIPSFIYPAQPSFVPALGSPAISGGHIIPAIPSIPASPNPIPSNPAAPTGSQSETPGDSDSAVIDSADFISEQQTQQNIQLSSSVSSQPQAQFPSNTFPNFLPQIPQAQIPSLPSIPQLPQIPQFPPNSQQAPSGYPSNPQTTQLASFPSIPQIPQSTQGPQIPAQSPSFPQYPQFPQQPSIPQNTFPQGPSPSPPTSFPGATNNESGLNDEDTISVESA